MFNEKTRDILIIVILVAVIAFPFIATDSIKSKFSKSDITDEHTK